uniref:Phospholipase B-like n=1 Tax=Pygocentrus nattereri TaxID=42514 RepID=A0AAR2JFJ5_PYGNA
MSKRLFFSKCKFFPSSLHRNANATRFAFEFELCPELCTLLKKKTYRNIVFLMVPSGFASGAFPGTMRVFICVLIVSLASPAATQVQSAVLNTQTGKLDIKEGFQPDFVAFANFTDDIRNTGWSYLEVVTNGTYNDTMQAYGAGVVESAVTSQVHLSLLQLQGLEDGYNGQVTSPGKLSFNPLGFLLFQMGGDLEDLEAALNKSSQSRAVGSGSCSALIKLLPGNKELLVSHDTWNNYQAMLRIMKKYNFSFRMSPKDESLIPGGTQAFSSYPGSIFSGDDFYILSSGLVTLETTIGNSNPDLWKFVMPQGAVMEWLRNIVANRLARKGKEWADIFSQYNSGTYNNQWMIVDYKNFIPGKPSIKEGLFTVLEQIPGMIQIADKTQELYMTGYWASYNIPYFEEVFNASGGEDLVKKYGSWFSYSENPRAQIFRRNQTLVTDMESMVRLMRYNNFKNDPLSECEGCDPPHNGENAISARSDLNPANGTYPFGALRQRPHGGTDMKVTSYGLFKQYELLAVSGPTWDEVPVFEWSTSPYRNLLHLGHPDRWDFPTVHVRWSK